VADAADSRGTANTAVLNRETAQPRHQAATPQGPLRPHGVTGPAKAGPSLSFWHPPGNITTLQQYHGIQGKTGPCAPPWGSPLEPPVIMGAGGFRTAPRCLNWTGGAKLQHRTNETGHDSNRTPLQ